VRARRRVRAALARLAPCARRIPCARLAPFAALAATTAWAGPPYFTDDPVPTDRGHYEIYAYADSLRNSGGTSSDAGVDFNYGGARDLQLTAVLPYSREQARGAQTTRGLGNAELAAKYRFLHQEDAGWDVAVFPRVVLASASSAVGEQHASWELPVWVGRDTGAWSTFGGGGCVLNHGDGSRNYCFAGWALARKFGERTQLGAELFHQSADATNSRATTFAGVGVRYDAGEHLHLLAYGSGGLQNAATEHQYSWYAALLFTY
jgi:hypothetical protein